MKLIYRRQSVQLFIIIAIFLSIVFFLNGCSNESNNKDSQANYQDIKEMINDSLASKEGREAITEALRDPEMKSQIIINDTDVKKAVTESINDPKNKKILEDTIKDPNFAAEFAKNIQKEHEELLKSLLKDPEYRSMMIEILKEPDFQSVLLDLLTSSPIRTQMQEVAKDAFTTPAMRLELLELLRKIQQEELEIKIDTSDTSNKKNNSKDSNKKDNSESSDEKNAK